MKEKGFALVAALVMLTALLALLGTYFKITNIELATTRFTSDSVRGFYAAEAGLNIRAEQIRQIFVGYNRPEGDSPNSSSPCTDANLGSGDFNCQEFFIGNHRAITFVAESPDNPVQKSIPQGELYQGLNAQEYTYAVKSIAHGPKDQVEAILELQFKSRLVPMFQFVAFYNKDLEILPGATMNLSGPIHTNGDLYLNSQASLDIGGQVSTSNNLYRGRKNNTQCHNNPVRILDPLSPLALVPVCPNRTLVTANTLTPWNGMIQVDVPIVTVPEPEALDPTPGQIYFDKADLRLALRLNGSGDPDTANSATGVEIRADDNSVDTTLTAIVNDVAQCPGSLDDGRVVGTTHAFYNNREADTIRMLEVDLRALFDCVHLHSLMGVGKTLADETEGGLVYHLTVEGPDSAGNENNYGARVRNAEQIAANSGLGAPTIRGLTLVSDQAFYLMGHFNSVNKKPAAVLSDSINFLSNAWSNDTASTAAMSTRIPADTTYNLAIMSGTDSTGGVEGAGGQGGAYNGGLENYPRLHENWSGRTLTYRGSFVSLNTPRHVNGAWQYGAPQYNAPSRNWSYDTDFNDAANLPPLSPRFVYLRQELFVRQFEQ